MYSLIINNVTLKKRFILAMVFLVGFSTLALAHSTPELDKLTKEEVSELIKLVKKDLKIDAYEPFIFDEGQGVLIITITDPLRFLIATMHFYWKHLLRSW